MTWLEDADGGLFDEIVSRLVAFVLFCGGCFVIPATIVIFWLTLRHREIRCKPLNWAIVNFALIDLVFGVSAAMQSASFVWQNETMCKISGALSNSMMTANLFSLAAIAAQFDANNRREEKTLLRLSSGEKESVSPMPAFTIVSSMLINLGIWFYVFLAAVPLISSSSYGPDVIGVCGVLPSTSGVLFGCHFMLVSSAILTCGIIIGLYYQRIGKATVFDVSRRISDISACTEQMTTTFNETEMALRLVRVSFLVLIVSRTGWFVAEIIMRTMHDALPMYVGRLLFMLTPMSSLINPWLILMSVEQYHQGLRGETIASADRCSRFLNDADALLRLPRIDSNLLHPNSFQYDWRVQSSNPISHASTRQCATRPLDIHRKSFSEVDHLATNYFRSLGAAAKRDSS